MPLIPPNLTKLPPQSVRTREIVKKEARYRAFSEEQLKVGDLVTTELLCRFDLITKFQCINTVNFQGHRQALREVKEAIATDLSIIITNVSKNDNALNSDWVSCHPDPLSEEEKISERFAATYHDVGTPSANNLGRDMDFKDLFCSPSGSNKKSKKRTATSETASGSNPEHLKRIKKSASKKCASTQLVIEQEKTPDTSSTPVAASTGEQALGTLPLVCATISPFNRMIKSRSTEATSKNKAKDLLETNQKTQEALDEANKKLKEVEANAKARVNLIAKQSIYRAWMTNPNMDLSFLGAGADEMLAF
uniref:Uncharacterized protein n=1 Tax=Cannabis sativa TaxID=3483 RepID=A0A803PCN6_CANSA